MPFKDMLKIGIATKITLMIWLTVIITTSTGVGLGYYLGADLLWDTVIKQHQTIANTFAAAISGRIDEAMDDVGRRATLPGIVNALSERDMAYSGMSEEECERTAEAVHQSPGTGKETISAVLKDFVKKETDVSELSITDRCGGLVASSGAAERPYHADESWWKESFNKGVGKIFVGGVWNGETVKAMIIALPIKGEDGKVLGIAKAVLNIGSFRYLFKKFSMSQSGKVAVINEEGLVIFGNGMKPFFDSSLSRQDIRDFLASGEKNRSADSYFLKVGKKFVVLSEVKNKYLIENGITWFILVTEDPATVLTPLYLLYGQLFIVVLVLVAVTVPIGIFFGKMLVRPINRLISATERLSGGDLDHRIGMKGTDEIAQLACSFDRMAENLKETLVSRDKLAKEVLEREKAEKQLKGSEKKYRDLCEASRDGYVFTDMEGRIMSVNMAYSDMLGYSVAELLKHTYIDLTPEKWRQAEKKIFEEEVLKKGYSRLYNKEYIRKDGTVFPVELQVSLARDTDGTPVGRWALVRDITDRKKAAQMQRFTQLGQIVGNIAHELNNPMQIVCGRAQLLLLEGAGNEKVEKSLKIIMEQIKNAKDIIDRLMVLVSPDADGIKDVNINSVLDSAVDLVEHAFSMGNIRIVKKYSPDISRIRADEENMREVFLNILRNAADAMVQGGAITITTETSGGKIYIYFEDNGTGISPENIDKIFDPFFSTKQKGLGLGLSVCLGIVRGHHGEIKVESDPGKGTKVVVILPGPEK